jgi:AcrR family transcriptional regulator
MSNARAAEPVSVPSGEAPRRALGREQIIAAALEIIDEEGPGSATMRRIADEFGVVPTAIHWHIKTREDLLRGVVDLVYEGVEVPPAGSETWEDQARHLCRAVRRQLIAHPNVLPLLPMASQSTSVRLYAAEVMIMSQSGLRGQAVAEAAQLIGAFSIGWAFSEALRNEVSRPDRFMAELITEWVREHGDTDFGLLPHATLAFDGAARFEEGLDDLIDGIRRRAQAASR